MFGGEQDTVVVDLSTLRLPQQLQPAKRVKEHACVFHACSEQIWRQPPWDRVALAQWNFVLDQPHACPEPTCTSHVRSSPSQLSIPLASHVQELEIARSLAVRLCEGVEGVLLDSERPPEAVPFNILPLGTIRPRSNKRSGPASGVEDGAGTDATEGEGHEHENQGLSDGELMGEGDTVPGSSAAQAQMASSTGVARGGENVGLEPSSSPPGGYKSSITWELKQSSDSAASLVEKLKEKVREAAEHTRELKEQRGMKNQDPVVKQSVEQLLQLKVRGSSHGTLQAWPIAKADKPTQSHISVASAEQGLLQSFKSGATTYAINGEHRGVAQVELCRQLCTKKWHFSRLGTPACVFRVCRCFQGA
eukprot:1155539-Pelagomonas_calceolata.AAC.2